MGFLGTGSRKAHPRQIRVVLSVKQLILKKILALLKKKVVTAMKKVATAMKKVATAMKKVVTAMKKVMQNSMVSRSQEVSRVDTEGLVV